MLGVDLQKNCNLTEVESYWDNMTQLYLQHMSTFQAGLLLTSNSQNDFEESNLHFARRAGIKPGDRILDAGCGVCAPSIDIASNIPGLKIDAVTISNVQVQIARKKIKDVQLEEQIIVKQADYHSLPYPADYFDAVIFFESFGYSNKRKDLLKEVARVLRPSGILYIKDVFRIEKLDISQAEELVEFNKIYVFQSPAVSTVLEEINSSGFKEVRQEDITNKVDKNHVLRSMFEVPDSCEGLTAFGQVHYRGFKGLPIRFHEIIARKLNYSIK